MSPGPDFERVGDLLPAAQGRPDTPAPDAGAARLVAAMWPEVVGPDVAANARPVQLRRGRLVVSASSSAWAQTLQLMSEAIVARLNERLGPGAVERAVFRHAGWEEERGRPPRPRTSDAPPRRRPPPGPSAAAECLSEEQETVLAAVDGLDLSPELREKMKRTIRAAFVRGEQDSVR